MDATHSMHPRHPLPIRAPHLPPPCKRPIIHTRAQPKAPTRASRPRRAEMALALTAHGIRKCALHSPALNTQLRRQHLAPALRAQQAAAQQRLEETGLVGDGAIQADAAAAVGRGAGERDFARHRGARGGVAPGQLNGLAGQRGGRERRAAHAQRLPHVHAHEGLEAGLADHFDHAARPIHAWAVGPAGAWGGDEGVVVAGEGAGEGVCGAGDVGGPGFEVGVVEVVAEAAGVGEELADGED